MKWIRWKGLIAFIILTGVPAIIWLLFVDIFVERMIEKSGTELNQAKVDVDDADLTLFPAGLTVKGLKVTNPDKPMENALEVEKLTMSIDGLRLLSRKVIVNNMSLSGIKFNTKREKSGAISRKLGIVKKGREVAKKTVCSDLEFSLPFLDIPDAQDILKKEKLESLEIIKALDRDIKAERAELMKKLQDLPGKEKFDEYKKRIEKITSGKKGGLASLLGLGKEFKSIQEELNRDIKEIKSVRKEFKEKINQFKERLKEAKNAPLRDVKRLKEKYILSPYGIEDLGQRLVSMRLCEWTAKALEWYKRLEPVVQRTREAKTGEKEKGPEVIKPLRGKGTDLRFKEYRPLPDLLVRSADASIELSIGNISGNVHNITPDQDVLGLPLTFNFVGDKLKGLSSLRVKGRLNHVDPLKPDDSISLDMNGYLLKDIVLSEEKAFPLSLKKAIGDLSLTARLRGDRVKADIATRFSGVQLSSEAKEGTGPIMKALVSSLSEIRELNVNAYIAGRMEKYNIRVTTNLDRILKDALEKQVKAQALRFEEELKKAILGKTGVQLGDTETDLGNLNTIVEDLKKRIAMGTDTLKGGKKGIPGGFRLPF